MKLQSSATLDQSSRELGSKISASPCKRLNQKPIPAAEMIHSAMITFPKKSEERAPKGSHGTPQWVDAAGHT